MDSNKSDKEASKPPAKDKETQDSPTKTAANSQGAEGEDNSSSYKKESLPAKKKKRKSNSMKSSKPSSIKDTTENSSTEHSSNVEETDKGAPEKKGVFSTAIIVESMRDATRAEQEQEWAHRTLDGDPELGGDIIVVDCVAVAVAAPVLKYVPESEPKPVPVLQPLRPVCGRRRIAIVLALVLVVVVIAVVLAFVLSVPDSSGGQSDSSGEPTDSCALPAASDRAGNLYGTFNGQGTQINPSDVYPVSLIYGEAGIITTYTSLACGNEVPSPVSLLASGSLGWTERIEFGTCIQGGDVTLEEVSEGQWEWFWRVDGSLLTVSGLLTFQPDCAI